MAAQVDAEEQEPVPEDIFSVGTVAYILEVLRQHDGTIRLVVEGRRRARIKRYAETEDYFLVEVEPVEDVVTLDKETVAMMRGIKNAFETYSKINPKISRDLLQNILEIKEPSRLADTVAGFITARTEDKQKILEENDVKRRLELVLGLIHGEIELIELEKRIRERVKKQMERAQKEYFLNEQMKAIQRELGEKDDMKNEIAELEEKLKNKDMPEEAREKVKKEINRLKMMAPMSAEATVARTYIDWMLSLPWNEKTEDKFDLDEAKKILDEDHYGLEEPKERILEFLAVRSLAGPKMKSPILCFVGPPGVGKTSLGKSIARAMGRKFVRISLGGVRDEAEIRGHRRTYIGALPGKIIQGIRKAGSSNPVFLLDEIDKLGVDFRGDPAAALLEVLDPEQNNSFQDHYLDVEYDLSDVLFITTANMMHTIPKPLLDRMEVIRIPGYTEDEKYEIAVRHLIPKQLEVHGLKEENIRFTRQAILEIIRKYTREAGVRNLERQIASVMRKVAKEVVSKGKDLRINITPAKLEKYLGVPKYRHSKSEKQDLVGIANGLAWTETGGEILSVEVSIMPGKGNVKLTGKLGEVMQESAHAAISYVRSKAKELGLDPEFYKKVDIHIHVPEGAIPKDGPSAGITMVVAVVSALTRIPVRHDVAMTGEITLRGRVLPVGGLKEKLLAAVRAEIPNVIVPEENAKDLKEVPRRILKHLNIIYADHMDRVLEEALKISSPEELWKKTEDDETEERSVYTSREDRPEDTVHP